MLATIRRLVACLVLLLFAASFIPWGGSEPCATLWWVERVQFVPALLGTLSGKAWAGLVLGVLLLLTLLFGRVFCSWLCPLGILQDIANRAARPRPQSRKGKGVRFAPNHPWLRAVTALLALGGLVGGSVGLLTWLDPYSLAARGMAALLNPLLAWAMGRELPPADLECSAPVAVGIAAFGLAVPLGLAVWRGRIYCNTLCPVGAVLGLLSRLAPCTPQLEASACGRCGACMKACKAQAIDVKTGQVDATRCVACYNCLSACSRGAMTLRPKRRQSASAPASSSAEQPPAAPSRRAFLGLGVAGLATSALPELPTPAPSTNPAEVGSNEAPAAVPPGAQSVERLLERCTACGLCIANCPTQVLRPSVLALGMRGFMKPVLDFYRASCDPSCTTCSQACPTGALLPLAPAEKRRTQIGLVQYSRQHCLVWSHETPCARCVTEVQCPTGALEAQEVSVPTVMADTCRGCRRCSRVCPAGAITRVEVEGRDRLLAVIDRSKCIGCGACAAACRPQAISLQKFTAPRLAHPEKCIGCGACDHICPTKRARALCVVPRAVHLTTPEG